MKKKNFQSIQEIFDHLESHALEYRYSHKIVELFRDLGTTAINNQNEELSKLCQLEMDVFNIVFINGEICTTSELVGPFRSKS